MNDYQLVIDSLTTERDELKEHCLRLQGMLRQQSDPSALPGIALNPSRMQAELRQLAPHMSRWPFHPHKDPSQRFYYDNPFFGCHDAAVYFCMLLHRRPQHVVEVGCGFSSCLLLDTRDAFLNGEIDVTLIDPCLDRFSNLAGSPGFPGVRILEARLQQTPPRLFEQLEPDDILFIDSSHICKTRSDVNHYLFEIFPRLKPGVLIHIHDILYPFEYPASWVAEDAQHWNEAYVLRAFLAYNNSFEILYWNNFVYQTSGELLRSLIPLCHENEGGSLWLRKLN